MAKAIIDNRYQVKITSSALSNNVWKGTFTVTNYSDEDDTASETNTISIVINDDYETYVKQMIEKTEYDLCQHPISTFFKRSARFQSRIEKVLFRFIKGIQ